MFLLKHKVIYSFDCKALKVALNRGPHSTRRYKCRRKREFLGGGDQMEFSLIRKASEANVPLHPYTSSAPIVPPHNTPHFQTFLTFLICHACIHGPHPHHPLSVLSDSGLMILFFTLSMIIIVIRSRNKVHNLIIWLTSKVRLGFFSGSILFKMNGLEYIYVCPNDS